jgi:hypothetical protein
LNAVGNMVKKYNGIWCQSLKEVANYLNNVWLWMKKNWENWCNLDLRN